MNATDSCSIKKQHRSNLSLKQANHKHMTGISAGANSRISHTHINTNIPSRQRQQSCIAYGIAR
ncbi:hypothetical protein MXE38_12210 [Anaerobiospirillum sp. NML120448]|uniref:hypothetical protein n=1 Tax=Anaerobiospirillum sp. NML120448 TaxID=2932816 RepID=UPI001FF0EEBF|nr:hypothetical protein [Anaerobiospirillum sp. NML120448]MCK0515595.1 hypothetical protein [Anaerobiospirillum sp. NML120448]